MREELLLAKARYEAASVESSSLVRQLHALQLQLHSVKSGDGDYDSTSIKEKLVIIRYIFIFLSIFFHGTNNPVTQI